MAQAKAFDRRTQEYLRSLPAVADVTATRIYYTDAFRAEALACYERGGSPVRIFREAGLDPKIIGYKRIERCFARWSARPHRHTASSEEALASGTATKATDMPAESSFSPGIPPSFDARDGLIARQAMRIDVLESEVRSLKRRLKAAAANE